MTHPKFVHGCFKFLASSAPMCSRSLEAPGKELALEILQTARVDQTLKHQSRATFDPKRGQHLNRTNVEDNFRLRVQIERKRTAGVASSSESESSVEPSAPALPLSSASIHDDVFVPNPSNYHTSDFPSSTERTYVSYSHSLHVHMTP